MNAAVSHPRWGAADRQLQRIIAFLVINRIALTLVALITAQVVEIRPPYMANLSPRALPGVWAHWDSGYYLSIAEHGYSLAGPDVNFFPLYPLTVQLLATGRPDRIPWVAFAVSNVAFILAGALLYTLVRDDVDRNVASTTLLVLALFPTSFFFSAIYSESLFLLCSVLVYWFAARKRLLLASAFVAIASLGRIAGFLLFVLPATEILIAEFSIIRKCTRLAVMFVIAASGLAAYATYLFNLRGDPLAFLTTQRTEMLRSITFPGLSILDSARVVLNGTEEFANNWFMRAVSVQDLLALALYVACAVLAVGLIRRKSLVAYLIVSATFLMMSHGPYSLGVYAMARYILPGFPFYLVLAILLRRHRRAKWLLLTISTVLLLLYTAWFVSGRWVA